MPVADITHPDVLTIPERLPFLEALCWQKQKENVYEFTQLHILSCYERGWHYRDIFGNPEGEEIEFLKQLAKLYHSILEAELCNDV
jgi:hypothetical protein